ncbi:hypothetical protein COLO4_06039 [Corchorus olitorius]|uniref:Uncharacterized protein n=1 Tax=Corchorus olitorius TaxID=93759 RepID=A0A1R3KP63_9ROSI|nr:hypothetical protein COLO4_06039 [Corchorus olitorius]
MIKKWNVEFGRADLKKIGVNEGVTHCIDLPCSRVIVMIELSKRAYFSTGLSYDETFCASRKLSIFARLLFIYDVLQVGISDLQDR